MNGMFEELRRNKWYYLMALPGLLFFLVFCYLPLPGILIAFKDYNFADGIFGSRWVGLQNFAFYFQGDYAWRTTFNTLFINANYIVFGTIVAVAFAILLNEIRKSFFRRMYQSLMFLPYFFSAIVVGNFVYLIFSSKYGMFNQLLQMMNQAAIDWYSAAGYWVTILVGVFIWKNTGYAVILYLATIVGIDDELYEAAALDGVNRWQKIRYITLPLLVPTVIIVTLLAAGKIFYGDFQTIYSIVGDNGLLFETTDVIDTYVFRAVKNVGDISMPAAVGLYQSLCGFLFVLACNWAVKKVNNDNALF
ncbi:ABC transporter permease [Paenibacillus mendelii]|uniref:ABC transporter permease n=1 Tax=Paenibacillus mendelii TaxID=206163 RepID=A0ABV6JEZ8_9BACL|nr:ABC transporter permease subunit [Paenibacillus mendelii]MCQ6557368.1 ABC transporter permease subunit [Paenibacillus mendelii]